MNDSFALFNVCKPKIFKRLPKQLEVAMISIIDDDCSVREAVKSLIRSLGYDAVTFASGEEYLGSDRVRDSECVITDLQMSGMTGIDLQHRLIADGYCKAIIFMSALSAEEARTRAMDTEVFGFLRKPFSDERLLQTLTAGKE